MIGCSYRLLKNKKESIMSKEKKGNSLKKELSEGQTIAIAVLVLAAGLIALVFGVQFLIEYFFPNF
jgi:hypothetical protein